ncbi:MAG TPA: histidine kinase dimerization/phospho-acceptor domain-containing protein [Candidatus Acidoferrum sp.]|nr:histidine kinase dimerization/phospho-acceptor domain-containing protein [Candidatus Acidoferrum sp.]
MKRASRLQLAAVAGVLLLYTIVSLVSRPSFALTAFSDITGTALWLVAIAMMLWAALRNQGRTRWFWILLAAGAGMVGCNLGAWLYYEVILGRAPPDPFWADIPLFLQPVPMMAAAAMRPGSQQREQKFHLTTLNFLILLLWWVCVYMFLVYPNEYILPNKLTFTSYYYALFILEFSVLLAVLGGMALVAQGAWRKIYWHLFLASSLYLLGYQWLNAALERDEYYSGSIYDVPNYAAICWFILIAVRARNVPSEPLTEGEREFAADMPGVLAALAVLSLPVIGLYGLFLDRSGSQLLLYRVSVTLAGILLMGVFVFLRQMLLNRELARLLLESRDNLERLQSAQSQLMQKERLAGVGQLVSGVAHELNNPLTAVIGYSDLLLEQEATGMSRKQLERLGAEARRIKRILDNLLSFARPQTEGRRLMDIAVVARESLMLCEHQLQSRGIHVEMNFAPNLPRVALNEGQFKRVFVNLFSNCADALEEAQEKKILVEGYLLGEKIIVRFSDSGRGFTDVSRAFDPFYTTRPVGQGTGLGLSICYGTVKEHNGNIYAQNLEPNGAALTIELPVG